jgi:glutaminase
MGFVDTGNGETSPHGTDSVNPILDYLKDLHARLVPLLEGTVATYIPELAKANPQDFGICLITIDGQIYTAGAHDRQFTIQSMSKPFVYGLALREHGRDYVTRRVGVEPTGEAFNSIILDEEFNRPFNPMVNAGAIAVAGMVPGADTEMRRVAMMRLFSDLAARPLDMDEDVFASERDTGHRNRAIAYMMLNTGMITDPPEDVLDLYFRQCSMLVTCRDMAMMAATLANCGTNPATGKQVFGPDQTREVLTVMSTCGMYDYAGQWAFDVGLPAKSGVSGGVFAVIPGQAGIAVYSPLLDRYGNSVRGIEAFKQIAQDFKLHGFEIRPSSPAVIRNIYTAAEIGSKRARSRAERAILAREGHRIGVIEVQGALFFGPTEYLIRKISQSVAQRDVIVVDLKRVRHADSAAVGLLRQMCQSFGQIACKLVFVNLAKGGALDGLRDMLEDIGAQGRIALQDSVDTALEQAESRLLALFEDATAASKYALHRLELFAGLEADEYKLLEGELNAFQFAPGDQIIREGDPANALFIIARGSVSISVKLGNGQRRRIGSAGPGLSIGETALVEGGARTADVFADEHVICYAISVERLHALDARHPGILTKILANLVKILAERLRLANAEIRKLE